MNNFNNTNNNFTIRDLNQVRQVVSNDVVYGREEMLVKESLRKNKYNTNTPGKDYLLEVAMKAALIDVTNSTNLSRHKAKISLYEIAETIVDPELNFDERVKMGDPTLVNDLARRFKKADGSGANHFSFASKYCCYHNHFVYDKDDYSIYDRVVVNNLPKYDIKPETPKMTTYRLTKFKENYDYEEFRNEIDRILNDHIGNKQGYRRKLDLFVWYYNR